MASFRVVARAVGRANGESLIAIVKERRMVA
jgi:hypothetical protein